MQFGVRPNLEHIAWRVVCGLFCSYLWNSFLEMRQKRFSFYMLSQALVIAAVVLLFKVIPDTKIASVCAGALFVFVPLVLMIIEWKLAGFTKKLWFVCVLQFWILFALPIFGLRIFNWDTSFADLSLFGVTGPQFHYWSNKSFMVMMAASVMEVSKNYLGKYKNKKPT